MLAASAALLMLIGFGISLAIVGEDDELPSDLSEDGDDEVFKETSSTSDSDTLGGIMFNEASETDASIAETMSTLLPAGSPLAVLAAVDDQDSESDILEHQDGFDSGIGLSKQHDTHSNSNSIAGGPGDTLIGGSGLDKFEVIVGSKGDPETQLQNLFEMDGVFDAVETIWLKDLHGQIISRETLLSSDFVIEDDGSRNGVTLSLNGHRTLFIDDVSLDDFTSNSLVLGNFQLR